MKITKYEHSCLVVEIDGRHLVIDPGGFSTSFVADDNTDAVIITHEHPDHFDPTKIAAIREFNPNVEIFTTAKVAEQIDSAKVAHDGENVEIGPFKLTFFGHDHAAIIDNIVPCDNIGVVVNDTLVDPGDSFVVPPLENPKILALPVVAPWLKINEVINYMTKVKPAKVFPIHNALLSKDGQSVFYPWVQRLAMEKAGAEFIDLQPGTTFDLPDVS